MDDTQDSSTLFGELHEPRAAPPHTTPHNGLLFDDTFLPDQRDATLQATQNEEFSIEDWRVQDDVETAKQGQTSPHQQNYLVHPAKATPPVAQAQVATDGSKPVGSVSDYL